MSDAVAKAGQLIASVKTELGLGTKHYHPVTGELLTDTAQILKAFLDHGRVTIEPTEDRQHVFRQLEER